MPRPLDAPMEKEKSLDPNGSVPLSELYTTSLIVTTMVLLSPATATDEIVGAVRSIIN